MKNKKLIINLIEIFFIIIIAYLISFLSTNYGILKNHNIGINLLNDKINTNDFDINNNVLTSKNNSNLEYSTDIPEYINKIIFNYQTENDFNWTMKYEYIDLYGNIQKIEKSGTASSTIDVFSEKIDKKINKISITLNNNNVSLSNLRISNVLNYFPISFIIFTIIGIAIFILYKNRVYFKSHVEFIFLILALCGGICEIILTPIDGGISWDEQIHFSNAYHLLISTDTKATDELANPQKFGYYLFNTAEEKESYMKHLNDANKVITNYNNRGSFSFNKITYLPQSIAMYLCNFFNFSFTFLYIFGKIINLLLYTVIIFFAIRKTPICKYTMTIIGLFPTALFLACNYSYDPPITSLILLGMAYLLYELKNNRQLLSKKNLLIILISFIVAACPKAIYAFLILLLLLLPKDKFVNNKICKLFKLLIIILLLLMVATFILPTAISPSTSGDIRGGNTSVSGQIKTILHSPISSIQVFWNNAVNQFFDKFFGSSTIDNFAYINFQSSINIYYLILILLFISVFLNNKEEKFEIDKKFKFAMIFIITIIIVMIWLALYLSFTPVGSLTVNGVQGRYFIPIVFPLILLLYTNKIKCEIDEAKIYRFFSLALILITFLPILDVMLY